MTGVAEFVLLQIFQTFILKSTSETIRMVESAKPNLPLPEALNNMYTTSLTTQ